MKLPSTKVPKNKSSNYNTGTQKENTFPFFGYILRPFLRMYLQNTCL